MSEVTQPTNPLLDDLDTNTFPEITITLPTRGLFYSEEMFAPNTNPEELSVRPFSMWDEVHYKNPFAVMSGKATRAMVQTVAPSIQLPDDLTVNDVEMIMLGGRMASFGDKMELEIECANPKLIPVEKETEESDGKGGYKKKVVKEPCNHKNKMSVDLKRAMQSYNIVQDEDLEDWGITLDNGQYVALRPLLNKDAMEIIRISINQERMLTAAGQMEEISDAQKEDISEMSMKNQVLIKTLSMLSSIRYVENKEKTLKIRDREQIKEWINSKKLPPSYIKKIDDKLGELAGKYAGSSKIEFVCSNCGYENKNIGIVQDPTRFFMDG
tara:strand:+ start:2116 stop:3093 length:978 start_codon:yes stop_codon:yes gene_type:complete